MRLISVVVSLSVVLFLVLAGCGGSAEDHFERGVTALKGAEYVAARAHLEKSISSQPGNPNTALAYNLIGVACWRLGETEEARAAFENSRNLDPTLAIAAYNLAVLSAEAGQAAQAEALLHEAALLDASDPTPYEYLAHLAAGRGDWAEAADLLGRAASRAPLSPRVLAALGQAEYRVAGPRAAMDRFAAALEVDPDYGPAYLNMAVAAAEGLGDEAEAAVWLEKYLATEAAPPRIESARAWLTALQERLPAEATPGPRPPVDPRDGTAADPVRPGVDAEQRENSAQRAQAVAAYNAGIVAHARKKWSEAANQYRLAIEADPTLEQAHINRAVVLHEAGKDAEAIDVLRAFLRQRPDHARAHFLLGEYLSALPGTRMQAEQHYRRFLELRPDDPAAERIRALLPGR